MRNLTWFGAALALVVPAGTALAAEKPEASATTAAAPVAVPAPPAGQSQVVFYRPSAMGMAISCNVRENGKMIGTTNNGRYFVHTTTPGRTPTPRGARRQTRSTSKPKPTRRLT